MNTLNRLLHYQWSDMPKMLGLAFLYALLIKINFAYLTPPDSMPIVGLPGGLGLAALLIGGRRLWPAIPAGALIAYVALLDRTQLLSSLIALVSNAVEPLIGIWLLRYGSWGGVRFDPGLKHSLDYIGLGFAGAISAGIVALVGTLWMLIAGTLALSIFPVVFLHWWIANFIDIVLFAPFILVWRQMPFWCGWQRAIEAALCFGLAFLVGQIIFLGWFHHLFGQAVHAFWMFLFIACAAVRFGKRGVSLLICTTTLQSMVGASHGIYAFWVNATHPSMLVLWLFMIIYSVVGTMLVIVLNEIKQTEMLRKSEERWKFALEGAGDGVWDWNLQTDEVDFSNRYKELYGYTDDDIAADPVGWGQRIHPDDRKRVAQDIRSYLDGKTAVYVNEHRAYCRDGSMKWVLARGMAVECDANGKPVRMVGTHVDITERKRIEDTLRRNEERSRHMLEVSPIAVRIKRVSDDHLIFANQAYARMFHTTLDKVIGETPEKFYQDVREYHDINDALGRGKDSVDRTLALRTVDGQDIWVLASFTHIEYENEMAILGWFYDVTSLKKAKELAEETAGIKANFIASMSHEIRTPMNAIVGLSQLALDKQISPEVRDYLEKIHLSSQSLLGILNDILDFSKLDAGRVRIEHSDFNLDAMLRRLHRLFSYNAEQKHLAIEIELASDLPRNLVGDALRIQQILSNLIGNAIKFTERGKIVLKVSMRGRTDDQVRVLFQVEDTGIGMSEKDRAALFVPFSQADGSITRRFGGTGLGLAISNSLLQLMGGAFSVQSIPGKGTTFEFELTLGLSDFDASQALSPSEDRRKKRRDVGALAAELHEQGQSAAGARILLAEDNVINQQVAADFLRLSGMSVEIASNGKEALELLEKGRFDAVLMDVNMPVMGGVEATRLIRRQPRFKDLPIIALTAGVTLEEREHCLASGMNHFVSKPIDPAQLVAVLSSWIRLDRPSDMESARSTPGKAGMDLQAPSGFDLDPLLKMLRGDEARVINLLCNFRQEYAGFLPGIKAKIDAADLQAAGGMLHALKGAAASMGAKSLCEKIRDLEIELGQGRFSSACVDEFRAAFENAMTSLEGLQRPE
jgi:PAS domain S-box-containing protein